MFWHHLQSEAPFCALFQHPHNSSSPSHILSGYISSGPWGLCDLASTPVLDSDLVPLRALPGRLAQLPILLAEFPALLHIPLRVMGLQSLHPSVSLRKPHTIVTCWYFILIKFKRIILRKKCYIHSWGKSLVLCFFRDITVVSCLGAMDIEAS